MKTMNPSTDPSPLRVAFLGVCIASLLIACSDGTGANEDGEGANGAAGTTCSQSVCVSGSSACYGNAVWTCLSDGSGWDKEGCGSAQSCVDGACETAACMIAGQSQCDDDAGGTTCAEDKLSKEPFSCQAGETCEEGVCRSMSCSQGETLCGYRAIFTCDPGGNWTSEKCGGGELCVTDAEGARCEPWACEPGKARCEAGRAFVCDVDGRVETETPCGDGQVCESGYCVSATCAQIAAGEAGVQVSDAASSDEDASGGEGGDAGPGDATFEPPPAPALEKISIIEFKLNGIPSTFDFAAQADYQESEKRFVISASGDEGRKIEINLAEVEPYSVGVWSDSDDLEVTPVFCYYDGTQNQTPPQDAGCSVGFSHASSLYNLEVSENDGVGFRVTGSFTATLLDAMGGQIELTEGTFDVLHK